MSSADWTAPTVERSDPELISPERQALEEWLDYHRATLLTKCSGLTGEQLVRRSVAPSSLSLLGLVRHMTEVERWWFRMHAGGEPIDLRSQETDADFDNLDASAAADEVAAYEEEVEAARRAVAGRSLDDTFPSRGDHPERARDLRWIYLHMVEEYARHNGHADLLREAIDGQVGD